MAKKIKKMTPAELVEHGKQLIKLAREKEVELKRKTTLELGKVLARELSNNWATPWVQLSMELERITGEKVVLPEWSYNTQLNSICVMDLN